MRPSAGVVGGGVYGVAAALELAATGFDVTLYERRPYILRGATANNFFRIHSGYHYPRDLTTAAQSRNSAGAFAAVFPGVLAHPVPAWYAIAAEGSATTPEQFGEHCRTLGLGLQPGVLPCLRPGATAGAWLAAENYYDPDRLRSCAVRLLDAAGVTVVTGVTGPPGAHDVTVVTAYAGMNEALAGLGCDPVELQYELCEVALVDWPAVAHLSLVVLDGPFCSIAPYRGRSIVYHVDHSVHDRRTGHAMPRWRPLRTRWRSIASAAAGFVTSTPERYAGSLLATRVVLPRVDATDERPYVISQAGDRVISVLSGKVGASVLAARDIADLAATLLGIEAVAVP